MSRLLYCLRLAWLDLTRLWSSTQHHVVIVAGIVLPLLLLMGLKRGHVAELRKELLRSPTGRQVVIWSTRENALLDKVVLDNLARELPDVELVIPEAERVAEISRLGGSEPTSDSASAELSPIFSTIYPTSSGDPILEQAGVNVLQPNEAAVVVSEMLAEKLDLKLGDQVTVTLTRTGVTSKERVQTNLEVKGVLEQPTEKSAIAYVDIGLINLFERWIRGGGVERFKWPASKRPAPDRYESYLLFVERPNTPSEDDFKAFVDRGLGVRKLEDPILKSLLGLIPEEKLERLEVWEISPSVADQDSKARLSLSPSELESLTAVDDMILAWNKPRAAGVDSITLIGLTLPNRSRIRAEFLPNPGMAFKAGEDLNEVILVNDDGTLVADSPAEIELPIQAEDGTENTLRLKVRSLTPIETPATKIPATGDEATQGNTTPTESQTTDEIETGEPQNKETRKLGIVPCQLLARLDGVEQNRAIFDRLTQSLVQVPEDPRFGKARLYATEIDRVPAVVSALQSRGFAVLSESGRIAEIQEQDNSLQLLVWIVGLGVLLFGILTVFSVLVDSTDRKRGTIGILRVMGVSRLGIFLMVVLRAACIGIIAGFAALFAGWLLALFFGWSPPESLNVLKHKPVMSILFNPVDLTVVLVGAVVCSCLGALLPAWRAAKVDPFDAIVEGRFK